MATDYTSLTVELANFLHRSDLGSVIPSFIEMAEKRFNRELRAREMESVISGTITDSVIAIPSDYVGLKSLYSDTTPAIRLEPKSLEFIQTQYADGGSPKYYAINGDSIQFWPDAGNVSGVYYKAIPSLQANNTNWLLSKWPDLYLFAAGYYAGIHTRSADVMNLCEAQTVKLIASINSQDKTEAYSGRLTARAS